jgi:hypothetical protein
MAQLIFAVALDVAHKRELGDLTTDRPRFAPWMRSTKNSGQHSANLLV